MPQSPARESSAVICVIGDEILTGRVHDLNGHFLARRLYEIGIRVERLVVLPDKFDVVTDCLRYWASRCDYVFTTGGIGPTHDDITREATAEASGKPLIMHPEAERIIREYYGDSINSARLAMARVPDGAELISNPVTAVPGWIIGNIFVFPGIPKVLQPMFELIAGRLQGIPQHHIEIGTMAYEGQYAEKLASIASACEDVQIGSYPYIGNPKVRSIIMLSSSNQTLLDRAHSQVKKMLDEI